MAEIKSINISGGKGGPKKPVARARLAAGLGIEGDGHAGPGPRQVSLLSWEDAEALRAEGADVSPGSFGENISTTGLAAGDVAVGDRLMLGEDAVVEVAVIGKECPSPCAIFRAVGRCIMPERGIFCRVIKGGEIKPGDRIRLNRHEKDTRRDSGGERQCV